MTTRYLGVDLASAGIYSSLGSQTSVEAMGGSPPQPPRTTRTRPSGKSAAVTLRW